MRPWTCSLVLAALAASPAGAASILYATAATPGRIDGFCLGRNGGLAPVPTVQEPTDGRELRRLLIANDVLYVASVDRVEAFRIRDRGGLTRLGHTQPIRNMNPKDMALSADGKTLYVPQVGPSRVAAYPIGEDGAPAKEFSSCIQGPPGAGYLHLLVNGNLLYLTAEGSLAGRVEVFPLAADGSLPALPDACQTSRGIRSPSTTPLSVRKKLSRPKAMAMLGNTLFVEERGRKRITAFTLEPDGNFMAPTTDGKKTKFHPVASKTRVIVSYEGVILYRQALLATQFYRGRVDSYKLKDANLLPKGPARISQQDVRMSPVRMSANEDVAYVAGGELDRVIAFRLREDGVLADTAPFSETEEQSGSFPNDVAVAVLPGRCD